MGGRVWTDVRNRILSEDYPLGFPDDKIQARINAEPGRAVTILAMHRHADALGVRRPAWFIADRQREQRLQFLREQQRAAPPMPVVIVPAALKPAVVERRRFPVARFSMLGGTVR